MGPMARPIAESFHFGNFIVNLVTADLTEEQARRRSRGGEGASVTWIIGHLLHYRLQTMNLLGRSVENGYEAFGSAGADDGASYPPVLEMVEDWGRIAGELDEVLEGVTAEQLMGPIKGSPHKEKKLLETISFFAWHESYHFGALGVIRREMGLTETAKLAMEAVQKQEA
jgi:hypothetical protein